MLIRKNNMRVLVTGSRGFIGKNLVVRLEEQSDTEIFHFSRGNSVNNLEEIVKNCDYVVHLAGENRPKDIADFAVVNSDLTNSLCEAIRNTSRNIPLILASSTQASMDNPYGESKLSAESVVKKFSKDTGNDVIIYRLPGVFGKWCKPNYNSVVATFCHNIANDLPIQINDPSLQIRLVYVDDVVTDFIDTLQLMDKGINLRKISPDYSITLGELAQQIKLFKNCRIDLVSERVGSGLIRALYSTYISYLPPVKFVYDLQRHSDERGVFVEMLKTQDSGQFSFFTAHPGVTRGGHYHHSKTEKFLVIKGLAQFGFRNIVTNEIFEVFTSGDKSQVVETVPGWTHDITNVGDEELVVMLWANEIFNKEQPDTYASKILD